MRTVEECRQLAQTCRTWAAAAAIGDDKRIVLEMAETWDRIAEERAAMFNLGSESLGD
jgi:hypothetical protein